VEVRQEKAAGAYVTAVQAMDRKYVGVLQGVVGPGPAEQEQALAGHSHGGVVGLAFVRRLQ
jgi:hypothetical protein